MNIVIDTNVFISGIFFGGYPRKVLDLLTEDRITAFADREIVVEYYEIIDRLLERKQGHPDPTLLKLLVQKFSMINVTSDLHLCRDADDDKFINCALDADAVYIVSGDKDLLDLKSVKKVRIVTAKDFIENRFDNA
ncbi:MAG: putative toxin-antitoxin system toxin component, PIN family [Clostridia bacterium]|nr:putative toxin-antitoxin system toxin component, PIN family [Clostridia bacterium]MBQ9880444.1 putative toxin-antitoxin system toxin component, PIN family [Clostridia bacterium]